MGQSHHHFTISRDASPHGGFCGLRKTAWARKSEGLGSAPWRSFCGRKNRMSDRQHVRMSRWYLTPLEVASSCLEARAAPRRCSTIPGNGTEKIGRSMKILVPYRDLAMPWPMTAIASAPSSSEDQQQI